MAQLMLVNPSKRPGKRRKVRTAGKKKRAARRRANPINAAAVMRRSRRSARKVKRSGMKRRRNPISMLKGSAGAMVETVKQGAIAGAGALAADVVVRYLPLPAMLKSGMMLPVTRIAVGLGLGLAAEKFAGRDNGRAVAIGAIAVPMYELMKGMLTTTVPALQGLGDYSSGYAGDYLPMPVPSYEPASFGMDGLGATDADGVERLDYSV